MCVVLRAHSAQLAKNQKKSSKNEATDFPSSGAARLLTCRSCLRGGAPAALQGGRCHYSAPFG